MEVTFLSVLIAGFILGIKHAIEPDHIIAVSTIASRSKTLWRSSLAGVFWGIGHTATLFIVGLLVILFKSEIPETLAMSLEFLVGVMLVYLGLSTFFKFRRSKVHAHQHEHEGNAHKHFHSHQQQASHQHKHKELPHLKSMLVGIIHGLAGSAAMVVMTMATVSSVWQGAVYILVFGLGTVVGMLLSTTVIGIPFVLSSKKGNFHQSLARLAGAVSTLFGMYYMYNLGINEGLFALWLK